MSIYGTNFASKSTQNKVRIKPKIQDAEKVIGSVCQLYNSSNMDMFYFFVFPYLISRPAMSYSENVAQTIAMYENDIKFIQKENNIKTEMCRDYVDKTTDNRRMKVNMMKAICALQFVDRNTNAATINMFQKEKNKIDMKVLLDICRTDFGCFSRIFDILVLKKLNDSVINMMKIMVDYVYLKNLNFDLALERIVTSEYFSDEYEVILLIFCKRDTELHRACISLLERTRPFSEKCNRDIIAINSSLKHLYGSEDLYTDKHGISRIKKSKYAPSPTVARYKKLLCPILGYLTEVVITELIVNCIGEKQSHYRKESKYHCRTGKCDKRTNSMYLENGYCSCREKVYDDVYYDCIFDEDDYNLEYDDDSYPDDYCRKKITIYAPTIKSDIFVMKKRHEQKYNTKYIRREESRMYNEAIKKWEETKKLYKKEEESRCPADDESWCYYCDDYDDCDDYDRYEDNYDHRWDFSEDEENDPMIDGYESW